MEFEKYPEREINLLFLKCEMNFKELHRLIPDWASFDPALAVEDILIELAPTLFELSQNIHSIEKLLDEVKLTSAVQNIGSQQLDFYRNNLKPNIEHIFKIMIETFKRLYPDEAETIFDPAYVDPPTDTPILDSIKLALAYCENCEFPDDDKILLAKKIITSAFFSPDEWFENAKEIDPIMGASANFKIPSNIRSRLKELYQSFVLGNYLANIALARAILEYALIDRSTQIGITVNDPLNPKWNKRLRVIVNEASGKLPELRINMESIIEAGNRTLHPKKRDNVVLIPNYLRSLALDSIKSVRKIIERLYLAQ